MIIQNNRGGFAGTPYPYAAQGFEDYGNLWDSIKKGVKSAVSSLDPSKKGSVTYATAANLVGEQNLQTTAAVVRDAKNAALQSKAGGPYTVPLGPDGLPLTDNSIFGMPPLVAMGAAAVALFVLSRRR